MAPLPNMAPAASRLPLEPAAAPAPLPGTPPQRGGGGSAGGCIRRTYVTPPPARCPPAGPRAPPPRRARPHWARPLSVTSAPSSYWQRGCPHQAGRGPGAGGRCSLYPRRAWVSSHRAGSGEPQHWALLKCFCRGLGTWVSSHRARNGAPLHQALLRCLCQHLGTRGLETWGPGQQPQGWEWCSTAPGTIEVPQSVPGGLGARAWGLGQQPQGWEQSPTALSTTEAPLSLLEGLGARNWGAWGLDQ